MTESYITCPKCGRALPSGTDICSNCNCNLKNTSSEPLDPNGKKSCPYCGEKILNVAIKCKHCGSLLKEGQIKSKRSIDSHSRRTIYIAAAVVAVVIIVISYQLNGSRSAPTCSDSRVEDILGQILTDKDGKVVTKILYDRGYFNIFNRHKMEVVNDVMGRFKISKIDNVRVLGVNNDIKKVMCAADVLVEAHGLNELIQSELKVNYTAQITSDGEKLYVEAFVE